jgi:DNA-binding CsgD family transcriptional regulator
VITGRSAELERLDGFLETAREGHARNVLVVGDAGMGKTTLLDAIERRARSRGFQVVRAAAPEGAAELSFGIVEDLARALPTGLTALDPLEADLLRHVAVSGAATPARVAASLLHLLAEASSAGPLLVLLDDLHWADAASLSALTLAAARLQAEPIALVATTRPRPAPHPRLARWEQVEVPPLPADAAISLLRASVPPALSARIPAAQAAHVSSVLGRCPLAIAECTRLLSEAQLTGQSALPEPLPLDARLREAWGGAFSALPAAAQDAVLALCVARLPGIGLLERTLAAAGRSPADLEPAVHARLVVARGAGSGPPPEHDLGHPLIRDAILVTAGPARVRRMHRHAAEAARALGLPPAVVIMHCAAGARAGDPAAIGALLAEAERAVGLDHVVDAARALAEAARLSASPIERSHLGARAARLVLEHSAGLSQTWAVLSLVDEPLLSDEERAWTGWLRAELLAETDLRESVGALSCAAASARASGSPAEPLIHWSALIGAWLLGDGATAVLHSGGLARWIDVRDPAELGPIPRWAGRVASALTSFQVGDVAGYAPALAASRAESAAWESTPTTDVGLLLNVVLLDRMMQAEGAAQDRRLAEAARRVAGDADSLSFVRQAQAERALRQGDATLARALVDESLDLVRSGASQVAVAARMMTSLHVAVVTGERARLSAESAELRSFDHRIGGQRLGTFADHAQGLLALAEGRMDEALMHLEPLTRDLLLGNGPTDPVPMGRSDLVEALVRSGDLAAARDVAAHLERTLAACTDPAARALLLRARAISGLAGDAPAALATAASQFRASGHPFEQARTQLVLGELLRRERALTAARHELRAAVAAFDRMGALPWSRRAQAELRATGSAVPRLRSDAWDSLTAQELRVATTVAAGASNRQAAETLFLSHRTVEYHLAAAFRKLGVSSRTALAHSLAARESARATAVG